MDKNNYFITLLVPVYNEHEAINSFYVEVTKALSEIDGHYEIMFVNDGSRDDTVEIIKKLIEKDKRIALVNLSRNFGKEAAMTAGLRHASGDAVVPIDVDLQDPPHLILDFVKAWLDKDYDMVYGIRVDRSKDTPMKRLTAGAFYRVFNVMTNKVHIPVNAGDFRLIDRRVIDAINQLPERNRFMKGIFAWAGFSSYGIPYERPERQEGSSKFNYWKLWNFALDGIVSFSSMPLRVWSYIGGILGIIASCYMIYIFTKTLINGSDVPGYASIMCAVLFLGSVQLISIGILGEYISRIFIEVKNRPVYILENIYRNVKSGVKHGHVEQEVELTSENDVNDR